MIKIVYYFGIVLLLCGISTSQSQAQCAGGNCGSAGFTSFNYAQGYGSRYTQSTGVGVYSFTRPRVIQRFVQRIRSNRVSRATQYAAMPYTVQQTQRISYVPVQYNSYVGDGAVCNCGCANCSCQQEAQQYTNYLPLSNQVAVYRVDIPSPF